MGLLLATPCCCPTCVDQFAVPISDIAVGVYEDVTGGDGDLALWDELTTSDGSASYIRFVRLAGPPAGSTFEVRLTSLVDPGHDVGSKMKVSIGAVQEIVTDVTVSLKQGSTYITTRTVTVAGSFGDPHVKTFLLTDAEAASITDWTNLRIEVTASATLPTGNVMLATFLQFAVFC